MEQVIDFSSNTWYREVVFERDGQFDSVYAAEWQFFVGEGELLDWTEVRDRAYDEGREAGYTYGYEQQQLDAQALAESKQVTDQASLQSFSEAFPSWVDSLKQESSVWTCDSDIRVTHPFEEEKRLWALWASQDCSDYDLHLTVVLSSAQQDLNVMQYGAELSEKQCYELSAYSDAIACEFVLKAGGGNFGLLFNGEFDPVFYEQEWILVQTFAPAFSWW